MTVGSVSGEGASGAGVLTKSKESSSSEDRSAAGAGSTRGFESKFDDRDSECAGKSVKSCESKYIETSVFEQFLENLS